MRKGSLIGAWLLLCVGALMPAAANADPTPSYTITCVVGGMTTANWSRAKLDQVTLEWFAAGSTNAYASVSMPVQRPTPPKGFVASSAGTNVGGNIPSTVRVSFRHADGSGSDAEVVSCA